MNDNIILMSQLPYMIQIGAFLFLDTHVLKKRFSFFVIWGIECAVQLLIGFNDSSFTRAVLQHVLAFAGITFLFEGNMRRKIACLVGTYCIGYATSLISALFFRMVIGVSFPNSFWYNEVWFPISVMLTSDILMMVIFLICSMILHKKHNKSNTKFIKSQLGVFIVILIVHYASLLLYYSKTTEINNCLFFSQVLIILLFYLQYFAICKNSELQEENYLLSIEQVKQENEKRYYELAQAKFDDVSKIRHDLNNHLDIAKQLILDNQKNEAQEIVEDICKTLNTIKSIQYCSHPLINTILTTKANEPAYKTIDMQFVMKDCDRIPCDTAELCSLFSNLFDNAARAALESGDAPVLQVESRIRNEFFVLKVTNSAKENAVPLGVYTPTTKNNSGHGYGFSIIATIAKKYDGNFILEQEEKFVIALVMLRLL